MYVLKRTSQLQLIFRLIKYQPSLSPVFRGILANDERENQSPGRLGGKIAIYQLGLINNQIVWRVGGPACLHCGNNKKENNLRKQVKCFLNKTPRNGQFFF